jgi:hypothetical protein
VALETTDIGEAVEPRPLYPMVIVLHAEFQPGDGRLMLVDLDDVIDVRDVGTGVMSREAWGVIQSLGRYAEVSRSMTGAHMFVKGRLPGDVDGWRIIEDLNECGHTKSTDIHLTSGDRDDVAAYRKHTAAYGP